MPRLLHILFAATLVAPSFSGCDSAIAPPEETIPGAIRADITYISAWPPGDQFVDIRFVAMRFVPQDTTDFLQLNMLEFSDRMDYGVASQTVVLDEVPVGTYPFAVVARQRTQDILSWGALGIYRDNEGVFQVMGGDTVSLAITVDFDNLPDFP